MFIFRRAERIVRWCILKPIWGKEYEAERIRRKDFTTSRTRPVV